MGFDISYLILVMMCAKFGQKRISTFRDNPLNPKLLNLEKGYMIRILAIGISLIDVSDDVCKVWRKTDMYFQR